MFIFAISGFVAGMFLGISVNSWWSFTIRNLAVAPVDTKAQEKIFQSNELTTTEEVEKQLEVMVNATKELGTPSGIVGDATTVLKRECDPALTEDSTISDQDASTFPCEPYRVAAEPAVIPGGTVHVQPKSGDFPSFVFGGQECTGPFCNSDDVVRQFEGDVIVVHVSDHYFHFMYETILRLYPLFLNGLMEEDKGRYRNATILCYPNIPTDKNFEFMKALNLEIPKKNFVRFNNRITHQVSPDSTMIVTRHNDYHRNRPYNLWLLHSLRNQLLDIVEEPENELFISRRGYRRAIQKEDELFDSLKAILPNLTLVLPDDYSVAEQAEIFANAKLVISPHGASLTNVIFSNWEKLTLIEFSPANAGGAYGSFRNDLRVKRHFLIKSPSVPCMLPQVRNGRSKSCDPWDRNVDVDVQNATGIVKEILSLSPSGAGDNGVYEQDRTTDFVLYPTYDVG